MNGRRAVRWPLVLVGAALLLAACAPAAPVEQAATGDATSTAPVVQPGLAPPVPIPTPAPPLGGGPLPPSMLEGGDRLPTLQELMARGLSRDEALREQRRLGKELEERWRAQGRLGTPHPGVVIGPTTAGSTVTIARKQITLPLDVYIENMVSEGHCLVGSPCGPFPVYILRRGDTRLWVNDVGKLRTTAGGEWGVDLPPGFEFLEALAQWP